jgi:hypothetical protein
LKHEFKIAPSTAIDNTCIFIHCTRLSSSCTSPIVNSPSDPDAQFLTVNNITTKVNLIPLKQRIRKINNKAIALFQHLSENKTWESVLKNKDKN